MNVLILGSCVSRDQLTLMNRFVECNLIDYVARQSLVSALQPGNSDAVDRDLFTSPFQLRSTESDFRGDLFERVQKHAEKSDLILMDLIDERRGCLWLEDGNCITDNWELESSSLRNKLSIKHKVDFGSDEHYALWSKSVDHLLEVLITLNSFEKLLLIAPQFADSYLDDSTDLELQEASHLRHTYKRYLQYLQAKGVRVAYVDENKLKADKSHRWGPRPFHFCDKSEALINSSIRQKLNLMQRSSSELEDFKRAYDKVSSTLERLRKEGDELYRGAFEFPYFKQDYLFVPKTHSSGEPRRLTIFLNGSVDRQRAGNKPVFQRSTWSNEIQGSSAFVTDPTLTRSDQIPLGWGQGSSNHWGTMSQAGTIEAITDFWRELQELDQGTGEVQLVGSSAGGFQALALAPFVRCDRVIVNNPQTDWLKYEVRWAVSKAIEVSYGQNANSAGFRDKWAERISIADLYSKVNGLPQIEYFVNMESHFDLNVQMPPLADFFENPKNSRKTKGWNIQSYSAPNDGHNPLEKQKLVEIVNRPITLLP